MRERKEYREERKRDGVRGRVEWREMEWEGDREREKEKWREMEQEEDRKGGDKVRKSCGTGTCSPDSSFLVWCGSLICVSLKCFLLLFSQMPCLRIT